MGSITVGGDPESYMEAPRLSQTDKPGAPSPLSSLLRLLGIQGKEVGTLPKGGGQDATQRRAMTPVNFTALEEAASAFKSVEPIPLDFGRNFLKNQPIIAIDPDTVF